ncbi:hypothetical protein [Saccharopolyspora oryzae]|uniref:Uncharacterized protein n=1 Tax=Saccharopolyspora oryzae TaxID=2997343 RepID=A0ABT4V8R6_9PSEU|nr:hypothetical protein [Saccharopolyspora oryzae]MDA3630358.1 hypothetical protein [Saccharopolyspora oryzae]
MEVRTDDLVQSWIRDHDLPRDYRQCANRRSPLPARACARYLT